MTYPGGKAAAGIYQTIINQIPPHRVYVEPFLGGGAIMLRKKPALCSIGVDSDRSAIKAFPHNPFGESLTLLKLLKSEDQPPPTSAVPGLTLICDDAISYLSRYRWEGDEFVYCDPPYLMETRLTHKRIYLHEFDTREQHLELLSLIKKIPAKVMISSYWSDLYFDELHAWRFVFYPAQTRSMHRVPEFLWMNYPEPLLLHDYRYLGTNFRERERIKRRQNRWKDRLTKMNPLERAALIMAIGDLQDPTTKKSE